MKVLETMELAKTVSASNKANYLWLLVLGYAKMALYYKMALIAQPGEPFYEKNIDVCINDVNTRKNLASAEFKVVKTLFEINEISGKKIVKCFLDRDKTGNFALRKDVVAEVVETSEVWGLKISENNWFQRAEKFLNTCN